MKAALYRDWETVDAGAIDDSDLELSRIEETLYGIYTSQSDLMQTFDDGQKAFICSKCYFVIVS